jgi:hypothetical protein
MNSQETLKEAMLSQKPISFQYRRIGKSTSSEVEIARVIFISSKCGKKTVTANFSFDNNHNSGWKNFDISSMFNVQILENKNANSAF